MVLKSSTIGQESGWSTHIDKVGSVANEGKQQRHCGGHHAALKLRGGASTCGVVGGGKHNLEVSCMIALPDLSRFLDTFAGGVREKQILNGRMLATHIFI